MVQEGIVNLSHFRMITTRNVGNEITVEQHHPHGVGIQTRDEFQHTMKVEETFVLHA